MTSTSTRGVGRGKREAIDPDSAPWDDHDDDERPAKKYRDEEEIEDEEEEERPRRKSSKPSLSDEEEEPPPIRRSSRKSERDEEDVDADGEETIIWKPQKSRPSAARLRSGSQLYFRYRDDEDRAQVIKFMDDTPWNYKSHWVKAAGRTVVPCTEERDCPICAIGDEPKTSIVYAIVNLSVDSGGRPGVVQALNVNSSTFSQIEGLHNDPVTGPLTKLWYGHKRTKIGQQGGFPSYNYHFDKIKDRDLEEDWDFTLKEADYAMRKAEPLDIQKVMGRISKKAMQDIAAELMDRRSS